jgi:1-aminocyclopropane-1-carboxylate deaminase/D-cysteine desulfhydrase-like pyridoxal-dependent ACC family enzyme
VGEGYARPTPDGLGALTRLACLEGLVLDPVYSAKAMAGLLDLAERQGRWRAGDDVVFLHTGGLPALWATEQGLVAPVSD